jgi:filamentous hemagglutinin
VKQGPDSGEMPSGRASSSAYIDAKISAQLAVRGWTEQEVRNTILSPPAGTSTDNTGGRTDTATVYGSKTGYVVINDATNHVTQISDKNDPGWVPDRRIVWK